MGIAVVETVGGAASFEAGGLESEEIQGQAGTGGEVAQGAGDVGGPTQAQQADDEIAQAGHDAGAVAGADLRAIFIKGDIADPVGAVFDTPVAAVELEQLLGGCLVWGLTGQAEDLLDAAFSTFLLGDVAFDAKDLADVGEVEIGVQCGGGADATDFQPTVIGIDRFSPEGGNAPRAGLGDRPGGWVGCP